jgi:tetratricopeptide (TPR) repeat protein
MGQAATLDSLGYAHTQLGQHTDAVDCYQRALDLLGRGERTYQHACVLTELATSYQAARNDVAATDASLEALSILQALRHPDADRTRARLSEAGISIR